MPAGALHYTAGALHYTAGALHYPAGALHYTPLSALTGSHGRLTGKNCVCVSATRERRRRRAPIHSSWKVERLGSENSCNLKFDGRKLKRNSRACERLKHKESSGLDGESDGRMVVCGASP